MDYKSLQSLAISFRIQLGFHAGNNEGGGGTNVMEPRRITVGDKEYDGISGEIVRHHILEHFVKLCPKNKTSLHQRCKGLVPDRCKTEVIQWMQQNSAQKLVPGNHYHPLTETILKDCALCDVGGYMVALEKESDRVEGTLKRDSCFEVGWLITEHPTILNYTQHSAYYPDPEQNNLFVQNMRTGFYCGVLRVDLDRIGNNDWWWLGNNCNRQSCSDGERYKRMWMLLEAIRWWFLSPSFAKQAGWLQHQDGTLEGAISLSTDGPAPFYSPIKFELEDGDPNRPVIKPNSDYRKILRELEEKCGGTLEVREFSRPSEFKKEMMEVIEGLKKACETSSNSVTSQPDSSHTAESES